MRKITATIMCLLFSGAVFAAGESKKKWYDDIKISGNLQVQWQLAQERGADAFAQGGAFPSDSDNRFSIRRGRLKMQYNHEFVTANFQINASPTGVSLVETNIDLHTRNRTAGLVTGVFYKPFGYLTQRGAAIRMQPELPRVYQALISSDIGLGAYGSFSGKPGSFLGRFRLDVGVLSEDEGVSDSFRLKNYIGRLAFSQPVGETAVVGLEGTVYLGSVQNQGDPAFTYDKAENCFVASGMPGERNARRYYDVGLRFETETAWGETKLFGECLWGRQPGYAHTSQTAKSAAVLAANGPVYNRKFFGAYVYFQQEIANKNVFFVTQFDYYDPNREARGAQVNPVAPLPRAGISKAKRGMSGADVAYTTLGVGLYYRFFRDVVSVSAWYDFVWNEKAPDLPGFAGRRKENVFTLRLQCAF